MNWHYLLRKMSGRATCIRAAGSRLGPRARIINIRGESHRIRFGTGTIIDGDLLVFAHGGHIEIGQWCFVGEGSRLWSGASIHIGDRVLIAHGVNVIDNLTHPLNPLERHKHFRQIVEHGHPTDIDLDDKPIRIENDAWLGAGSFVLRGVTVGSGAVVAAGAVVTSNVEPMTLVAGNPAQLVRKLD